VEGTKAFRIQARLHAHLCYDVEYAPEQTHSFAEHKSQCDGRVDVASADVENGVHQHEDA